MNLLSLQLSCSSTSSSRGRGFKSSRHILKESGLSKGDKRTEVEEAGLYEKKRRQQGQTADSSADQGGKNSGFERQEERFAMIACCAMLLMVFLGSAIPSSIASSLFTI